MFEAGLGILEGTRQILKLGEQVHGGLAKDV